MGLYAELFFPWVCNWALDRPSIAEHRQALLEGVDGEVLEIGFGTGLNLPHYPQHVGKIIAVDSNLGMIGPARRQIERSQLHVEQWPMNSEDLVFADDRFDSAVSTLTLCSIQRVDLALGEIYRVLKPGGRLFILEHGLSADPGVQKWQRRLNRLQRLLAGNCHLDRNIRQLVEQHPFRSVALEEICLDRTPRTHGYVYRGVAMK